MLDTRPIEIAPSDVTVNAIPTPVRAMGGIRLPPDAVDRMVIYKPVEAGSLFGLGSGNGVLMIYTKGN